MKIKPIASNMTELLLNDGTQVLFSYQTPVACWVNGCFYQTNKKWSNTTNRHIKKWVATISGYVNLSDVKDQDYFDNLVKGV